MLIPNAAVFTHYGKQLEISERAYDKLWDLNVKSVFFIIKESIELIRKAGPGANILIISSIGGSNPPWEGGLYGSNKAALENMIKWLKDELRPDGIRVNGLAPGLIKTDFSYELWKNEDPSNPDGKMGESSEIGSVAAMICSKDGSFVNGVTVPVHGGWPKL